MTLEELKKIAADARTQNALGEKLRKDDADKLPREANAVKAKAIINALPENLLAAARSGASEYLIKEVVWPLGSFPWISAPASCEVAGIVWSYCKAQGWRPAISESFVSDGPYDIKAVRMISIRL
jgi:hypothetical protein